MELCGAPYNGRRAQTNHSHLQLRAADRRLRIVIE
jgi:hypothetical protein